MNVFELGEKTANEEIAFNFACELGLLSVQRKKCLKCNGNMVIESGRQRHNINKRFRCVKRGCRSTLSIFKQSIFHNSKVSVATLLRLIYFFAMKFKVTEAILHCNISSVTGIKYYKLFRRICSAYIMNQTGLKIGGEGFTVEVDETFVSRRKFHTGRILASQSVWLVGGICRENGQIFLKFVTKRNAETLTQIIVDSVLPGTRIITDCWRGYLRLNNAGYFHATVNHTYNFISPENPSVHTQSVERLWRSIKTYIPRTTRKNLLDDYGNAFIVNKSINIDGKLKRFYNFVEIIKLFFN